MEICIKAGRLGDFQILYKATLHIYVINLSQEFENETKISLIHCPHVHVIWSQESVVIRGQSLSIEGVF